MKSFLTSLVVFVALSQASPLPISVLNARQADLEATTDTILFTDTIDQFLAARAAQDPPELDWVSNGCTASPDQPLGWNFLPSCQRHDFGYHNYKNQGRFTDDNKALIDSNFKNDMYDECNTHSGLSATACKGLANVYYEAVSAFGSK
ncbi:hypothetical protein H2198_001884 [Neophaeococcomyces mojaviensis]|uniref:Uncharacterized protein n=1 Tax=Neophaeococcomyces mojaviensis TaxID=3383035 RepID=A0ACC3AGH0_9EURO|nr:hypothetical protein H2198_001884 [Knufia sp. JES_112]